MPKLVAGWVLGTHNFNCKSSSLFTRNKLIFLFSFFLYFISHLLLSSAKQSQRKRTYTTFCLCRLHYTLCFFYEKKECSVAEEEEHQFLLPPDKKQERKKPSCFDSYPFYLCSTFTFLSLHSAGLHSSLFESKGKNVVYSRMQRRSVGKGSTQSVEKDDCYFL